MTRTVFAAALLLCGCAATAPSPRMSDFEAMCRSLPFEQFGGCIEHNMTAYYPNWRSNRDADLVNVYLSWLNAAGARVSEGTMSEPDARYGAAELYVRMRQIGSQRDSSAAIDRQAGINNMLLGLALMNASQPQPGPMVICNTTGYGSGSTTICH